MDAHTPHQQLTHQQQQQQQQQVSTPGPALVATAAPAAAAPPPTPLEVRQWRRATQRELRLALTAFKAGRDRFAAASTLGQQHATQLTNHALSAAYLPALQLGVLSGVQGLKEAAAGKLRARHAKELVAVEGCCNDMAGAVQSMEDALAAVEACQQPNLQWHAAVAPFAALTLPVAVTMLHEVLDMYAKELVIKWKLLTSFMAMTDQDGTNHGNAASNANGSGGTSANANSSGTGSSTGKATRSARSSGKEGAEALRQRSTVALATWLARPYVEEERVEELLQLLGNDMAGF